MDKNTKEVVTAWNKSGVIGKILIAFIVLVAAFLIWDKVTTGAMLSEYMRQGDILQTMVENQAEMNRFKRCIKDAHDEATAEFDDLLKVLGGVIQSAGIPFPQDLNLGIQEFRKTMALVKDCLIFPEES